MERIQEAERKDWRTYTYLYFSHPDKLMHSVGVEDSEVGEVMQVWAQCQA